MTDTPRIYVTDLAAFNAGALRGIWIDATRELGEIQASVQAMLEL
ncbi:MAG: antirestriction protein ArdA [Alphaproteobacteria bacterium]|nr:antirestriction protein ArdA [Alphaproteobacteria bacterium]